MSCNCILCKREVDAGKPPMHSQQMVKSLKAVRANYAVLLKLFLCRSTDKEIDNSVSAKALGFFEFMASFECFFMLTMIIEIFNRIEILNTELQKSNLSVIDSYKKVNAVRAVLEAAGETKFEEDWKKSMQGAVELELDDPMLPRQRKISKWLEQGTSEARIYLNRLKNIIGNSSLKCTTSLLSPSEVDSKMILLNISNYWNNLHCAQQKMWMKSLNFMTKTLTRNERQRYVLATLSFED
ncbi:uncharacterized protein LOC125776358 isoform X2 [Bactrocera dorsalis]|uniref:Uncharacterized protein LOC125776358 isoform X2 n=1 Tax=Bactrocera dorsalis TaxID=27457 RepID=A0ABM3J4B4_BACDO|nr:uncharacterized protein LOC125776358 isoform X2 [Bactrocera dorsalis]